MPRLLNDRRGNALIEFALLLPVMLAVFGGLTEFGRAFFQSHAVSKSLRAAALMAATSGLPLGADAIAAATNLAKTGTLDGSGDPIVPGWTKPSADLKFTPLIYKVGGRDVPVIRLTAAVPYVPIFPVVTKYLGFEAYTIRLQQEQAHVE
ncbi:MAG: hypothetical protein COW30_09295 [Rhodospirillales bacterium CG15_BIG_FIL_POST_REV_8_21_14_020_66_15]|nr:MAG: hypothetical protein COW30_09295 [Rhodospirillales bacterium CG15_BIG_FIL_POST_REV_8_21_14_020_66_15]